MHIVINSEVAHNLLKMESSKVLVMTTKTKTMIINIKPFYLIKVIDFSKVLCSEKFDTITTRQFFGIGKWL